MPNEVIVERVREAGLCLSVEALQALEGLPEEHALELVDAVKAKADAGGIKNPSNYICATIARGYIPQAAGGAVAASIARSGSPQDEALVEAQPPREAQQPPRRRGWDSDSFAIQAAPMVGQALGAPGLDCYGAETALYACRGMAKVQEAGVTLSDEAMRALLQIPTQHASELLESVAERHTSLRDPSNYIVATVAKGFVSKAQQLALAISGGGSPAAFAASGARSAAFLSNGAANLIPPDITPVESRVLELNGQDLWSGQAIGADTLLSLRCVEQGAALDLLSSLEAKGRGKGKGGIRVQNPNNYIQAAVIKMKREMMQNGAGPHGGVAGRASWARQPARAARPMEAPSPSEQRAQELQLPLSEQNLELISRIPVADCNGLLETASLVQSQGDDPNEYIFEQASKLVGLPPEVGEDSAAKRRRTPLWV